MTRSRIIAIAYLMDWVAGDPESFPHPVRVVGRFTEWGESLVRHPGQDAEQELLAGAALTVGIVAGAYLGTAQAIRWARRFSPGLATATEILLGWTCLASRNLVDESWAVIRAAEQKDLPLARQRLARIVGRDTQTLNETEIARAVIETLAESACDGIVAPLFYMAIGGIPLAMAYKASNTLDSMIGHTGQRYFYFGKVAARVDDAANFFPSRLTAFSIGVVASVMRRVHGRSSLRTWWRDGGKHKSPNAGQPESAMAGALRAHLGGENTYAGELIVSPMLGAEFPPPTFFRAKQALRIVSAVSLMCAVAAIAACWKKNPVRDQSA